MHILTGNVLLLLLQLGLQVLTKLFVVFPKLQQMLLQPLLNLFTNHIPRFPRGLLLRGLADLQQKTQDHRIVGWLAWGVGGRGIGGRVSLELVDEVGEVDEWGGVGGDGVGDGFEAGLEDIVA